MLLLNLNRIVHAGATAAGACAVCQAGTYSSGSGIQIIYLYVGADIGHMYVRAGIGAHVHLDVCAGSGTQNWCTRWLVHVLAQRCVMTESSGCVGARSLGHKSLACVLVTLVVLGSFASPQASRPARSAAPAHTATRQVVFAMRLLASWCLFDSARASLQLRNNSRQSRPGK